MKRFCAEMGLFWVTFGVLLTHFSAYAIEHDLECYKVVQPSAEYVLADSSITPKVGVANLGTSPEYNFYVHFLSIDTLFGDTVYAESVLVDYIDAYPDSIELDFPEWTPQGRCAKIVDDGPFVWYEMVGFTHIDTDEDHSNDTVTDTVTSLWKHDVGVIDLDIPPPTGLPDYYPVGSQIIFTVTSENFGFNQEHDVPVRLEVWDMCSDPDTLLWQNIQAITVLDWRGNDVENPYTFEVVYPAFTVPLITDYRIVVRAEYSPDDCTDDDEFLGYITYDPSPCNEGAEETENSLKYLLNIIEGTRYCINFTLPLPSWVRLDVYDASGRFVRNLYNDPCSAGSHSLSWNGRDSHGAMVSSGAYFIKMQAGTFTASSKLIVIK